MYISRARVYRLSSLLFLLGYAISLVFALDPLGVSWGATLTAQFLIVCVFIVSALVGLWGGGKLAFCWVEIVLLLAFLVVFSGGAWFVLFGGGDLADSFIRMAIPMLIFFAANLVLSNSYERKWLEGKLLSVSVVYSVLVSTVAILWFFGIKVVDALHVYHEEVFILGAAAIGALVMMRSSMLRWVIAFYIAAGCLSTNKLTGYLVFMLVFTYGCFQVFRGAKRYSFRGKALIRMGIFSLVFASILVVALVTVFWGEHLPGGSAEVRTFTYLYRLHQFSQSPVFGSFFSGSTLIDVDFYQMVIPSHSDVLDVLAFGGGVSFSLMFFPILYLIAVSLSDSFGGSSYHLMMVVLGLVVMLFNPILNQPVLSIIFWCSLAMLASYKRCQGATS